MATNAPSGDGRRRGAVRKRSQVKSGLTGKMTKRSRRSGRFLDQKDDGGKFKGVRLEKKKPRAKPVKARAKTQAKSRAKPKRRSSSR